MFNKEDRIILIEFENIDIYKKHFTFLYSHVNEFDNYFSLLYKTNENICGIILNEVVDLQEIVKAQQKFKFSPWSIPWIEYIDNEFIATIFAMNKNAENEEVKVFFKRNFYLFVEDKKFKEQFFKTLDMKLFSNSNVYTEVSQNYYFYKTEKFKYPITFSMILDKDKDVLAFSLCIHNVEAFIEKTFSKESLLKEKNFMYFYKTLIEIKDNIWLSMNEVDNYSFVKRVVIQSLKENTKGCI